MAPIFWDAGMLIPKTMVFRIGTFIPHFPSIVDIQCGEKAILL